MSRKRLQTESAELVRIEHERNMARAYRVALWPDLFGGVTLMREWGRIGRAGRLRLDPYPDVEAARDAMARLVDQKRRRGYREAA
jgi:predicted DNA-binding WGR domain protein